MNLSPREKDKLLISMAAMVARSGWTVVALHRGTWSGRPGPTLEFQDLAVLT